MSEPADTTRHPSTFVWAERERLLKTFEDRWREGRRPAIDDYLPANGDRLKVLVEMVCIDLEYRLKAGEPARVEDYLRRYPELAGERGSVLELIAAEYDLRRTEPGLS